MVKKEKDICIIMYKKKILSKQLKETETEMYMYLFHVELGWGWQKNPGLNLIYAYLQRV